MIKKEFNISKDYYIYIINDILSCFEKLIKARDKNIEICTIAFIPETSIVIGNEIISITKHENKIILTSNVYSSVNDLTEYSTIDYLFKNNEGIVIGTYPPTSKEQIDYINEITQHPNFIDETLAATIINWRVSFSIVDTHTIGVEFVKVDLLDVYGIDWSTIDLFICPSIISKFNIEDEG